VEWAMRRLLRHPDKLEKVRAELAASLGSKEFVEESDLEELPYLHAVVKEVMRLHPSLPMLPREVVTDDGMSLGGFWVPKGTCIGWLVSLSFVLLVAPLLKLPMPKAPLAGNFPPHL
jgi:cytochrome P450